MTTTVAQKRSDCSVCAMGKEVFQAINEAIWDGQVPGPATRVRGHATRCQRIMAAHGYVGPEGVTSDVDRRTIYRHRDHVEKGAREADGRFSPQTTRELTVYATDFVSVTDRAAGLGMQAMDVLAKRMQAGGLDAVEDKTLATIAATGLKAAQVREVANRADKRPDITITAIFGVSGGFVRNDNEYRVIEGQATTVDLKAVVEEERLRLKARQVG